MAGPPSPPEKIFLKPSERWPRSAPCWDDDVPKAHVEEAFSFIVPLAPPSSRPAGTGRGNAIADLRLRVADASGSTVCQFVDGPA